MHTGERQVGGVEDRALLPAIVAQLTLWALLILQQRRVCPSLTGSCPYLTDQVLLLVSLHPASSGLKK